jgi:hypothetical protein
MTKYSSPDTANEADVRRGAIVELNDHLRTSVSHLSTNSLIELLAVCKGSVWDFGTISLEALLVIPGNSEYRIAVAKKLFDIDEEMFAPVIIRHIMHETTSIGDLSLDDITEDHMNWVVVNALIVSGALPMVDHCDLGDYREPVDAAKNFIRSLKRGSEQEAAYAIIQTRRVYTPKDILFFLGQNKPLDTGLL